MYMILLGSVSVLTAWRINSETLTPSYVETLLVTLVAFGVFVTATPWLTVTLLGFVSFAYLLGEKRFENIIDGLSTSRVFTVLFSTVDRFFGYLTRRIRHTLTLSSRITGAVSLPLVLSVGGFLAGTIVLTVISFTPSIVSAQIVEPGFESEVVATSFVLPTAAAFTPDGRIFVAQKGGAIKVVKNGVLLAEPLLEISDINTFGDRGLLGLAVDPNFASNGYIYVSYAHENSPGVNFAGPKTGRIVRFTVVGDTASESSKYVLVGNVGGTVANPSCEDYADTADCIASDSNSHSVGGLRFGPDGKLYASLGDGADFAAADTRALRAQNIDALAGKVLRINTDGTGPADNPFFNGDPNANRSKVYAFGVRNMFRFNFNELTGKLYGGDVGWGDWEEVNEIVPGANYGWPCKEGAAANAQYNCTATTTPTDPLYTYAHDSSGAGSITNGAFLSSSAYPAEYETSLLFADFAQTWMKRLVLDTNGEVVSVEDFIEENVWPVEILEGPDGTIYYLDIVSSDLVRITHTEGNRRPIITATADPTSGLAPLAVTFNTEGTVDPDGDALSYSWVYGDGFSSAEENPIHMYTINGSYTAVLTVTDANGAQVVKSFSITVGDQTPEATITSPASGALYLPLESVTVTGEGTDPEDGLLPDSAFSWDIILHHNIHEHTLQQFADTKSITFTADDHEDNDVYIEIILTVTDSAGLTDTQSINMYLNNGTGSGNLVSNPSVEIVSNIPDIPLDWFGSWYGSMNPTFTYPVSGFAGDSAAQIDIVNYAEGSAKWHFSPVFITAGEEYVFSNQYTATIPTEVLIQYKMANGSTQYEFLAVVPAASTPTTNSFTFTPPTGAETLIVFHEITQNGSLTVDDFSVRLASEINPEAPAAIILSPETNSTVSGVTNIVFSTSDDVGVTLAHLYVDGVEVAGLADNDSPWVLAWDSRTVANGAHQLQIHVHDGDGNTSLSDTITLTVDNSGTTPENLIENGDFEITDDLGSPVGWTPGGYGDHTRTHNYPVVGPDDSAAAEVVITNYPAGDNGNARWDHDPIQVTSGIEYEYTTDYKASTISDVIGRYTFADGSEHFFGLLKEIPDTPTWQTITNTFVPPAGAETVTLLHLISTNASLTVDNVSLQEIGTGTPSEINPPTISFVTPLAGDTVSGTVTLRADSVDDTEVVGVYFAVNGNPEQAEVSAAPYTIDWDSTAVPDGEYVLKATTHDIYGNNDRAEITVTVDNSATPPPPPPTDGTNLIPNGNLEVGGATPTNWNQGGWGTNERTFTYPTPGAVGDGAKVEITDYTSGDAKWYFDDVAVSSGSTYDLRYQYNSSIPTDILARFTLGDGATQYQYLTGAPATGGAWQTMSNELVPPTNAASFTLFHVINGVGELTVDEFVLRDQTATSTDTTNPVVSLSTPADGTTVSAVVTVDVLATDESGIAQVELLLDGTVIDTDTTFPYSFSWDTTSVTNGLKTLSARAVDINDNSAEATTVTVTVDNSTTPPPPPPTGANLIQNGNLEAGSATPTNWNQGGWGTNEREYTYPVTGATGSGANVAITSYTSGDAKWYFDDVAVISGEQYTLTYSYNANIPSNVTVRYLKTDGTYVYAEVASHAATSGWVNSSVTILPPADVQAMTVMHIIYAVGEISVDDYSLISGNSNTFDTGMVTFSFDDGWAEHSSVGAPMLEAAGYEGTFYVISDELTNTSVTNLIPNGNLEAGGATPTNWNQGGWGTNEREYTYPVTGATGSGAKVAITSYTSGDAKWYFDDVAVSGNTEYVLSTAYTSTVESAMILRYTLTGGGTAYSFLDTLPSTNGTWDTYNKTVLAPSDAVSVTAFHVINGVGELTVDDYMLSSGVAGSRLYISLDDALAMQAAGHEIGGHTLTHTSLTGLDTAGKIAEIAGSRNDLLDAGFSPVESFAYPYGDYDDEVQTILADAGFSSGRSVDRGFNDTATDVYALKIQQVGRNVSVADISAWIDQAEQSNTWLILMFHQINDDPAATFGTTESELQSVINYTTTTGVNVVTVAQGRALMN